MIIKIDKYKNNNIYKLIQSFEHNLIRIDIEGTVGLMIIEII